MQAATALVGGDAEARRDRLLEHCETARAHGWDELASTVYSNVANLDVEHAGFRAAERLLEESLPFTDERDIPICRHWQTGVRTRLHFARGLWSAALEDAATVLAADGMPLATMWPLLVSALVPLRRGEDVPDGALDQAWALAEQLDEPLRRLAVSAALAEISWMTGTIDDRVTGAAVDQLLPLRRRRRRGVGPGQPRGLAASTGSAGRRTGADRRSRTGWSERAGWPRLPTSGGSPATRSPRRWPGPTRPTPMTACVG